MLIDKCIAPSGLRAKLSERKPDKTRAADIPGQFGTYYLGRGVALILSLTFEHLTGSVYGVLSLQRSKRMDHFNPFIRGPRFPLTMAVEQTRPLYTCVHVPKRLTGGHRHFELLEKLKDASGRPSRRDPCRYPERRWYPEWLLDFRPPEALFCSRRDIYPSLLIQGYLERCCNRVFVFILRIIRFGGVWNNMLLSICIWTLQWFKYKGPALRINGSRATAHIVGHRCQT